ncbi:MAG: serine/threonine-protein kinase [Kofleriaceae bacterium]
MNPAPPQPGEVIAGYRLGAVVGAGGAGTVYATTGRDGGPLAIKVIPHDGGAAARGLAARELAALRRLEHPNVVAIVDGGVAETCAYVVMPWLDGVDLRALLADGGVGPDAAVVLVAGLAAGVAALHAAGLVHRDLKPDNAVLTAAGQVVVLDLGLAHDQAWTRRTEQGAVAGSVPYLAPEQIAGDAGPAADVWALGVVLYELTCGERPFGRGRAHEEVAAILAGSWVPLDERDRRVDPALAAVVKRCLRQDPAARWPDAAALVTALAPLVARATDGVEVAEVGRRLGTARAAWCAEVARREAARAIVEAAAARAAGEPFAALRALDRGLAYQPDDPGLAAALALALAAPPAVAVEASARPRAARRWWWGALAAGVVGAGVVAALAARGPGPAPSLTTPEGVMATVFAAARTGDTRALASLCLPGKGDGDVRQLCAITAASPDYPKFRALFRDGRVTAVRVGQGGAEVDFTFAGKRETMRLIHDGQRYYLGSF